ncbi:MAG: SpaH/EbpB family LPXTG-anchored major pilin, partial [Clostridium perfringens]|nr:SpaH/EbpB family LPXTG-anchored major pilin [Clostridium perfringens]
FITTSIPVFAATPSISKDAPMKGSITISKKGATFTAYKLLDATKSGDAYEYSVNSDLKDFFNNPKYGSYSQEAIPKLSGEEVKEFAVNLHKYVLDNKKSGQELTDGQKNTVDLGYYLVAETSSNSEGAAVASTPIIVSVPQVSGDSWNYDVTINPKDNTPILEKNIVKENQRVKTSSENIGDVIKYEVKASIPVYQKNVQNIMYKFTDTMSKGLTYDEQTGLKVTSGDKVFAKDKDYTVEVKKQGDGETVITINFVYENIKAYAETGITLNYQATLNKDAVTDKVTTYTFGFGITKVDSELNSKLLQGAEFSVKDAGGKTVAKYTYDEKGQVVSLSGNGVTNSNGIATFLGLKEGKYLITEEVAPSGYSLLKNPVEVTITANKDESGNYTGAATIEISNGNKAGQIINDISENDGNILFNVQIENHAGFSLPSTGGLGNTGFIKIAIILLSIVCVLAILGLGYTKFENSRKTKN